MLPKLKKVATKVAIKKVIKAPLAFIASKR